MDEIKANVSVNVTIANDKVIFIQKREDVASDDDYEETEAKDYDESEEEISDNKTNEETLTVKAISKTRDYYLFEEAGEKEWFTIAENVKNFLKDVKKGDVLKAKVEVSTDKKNRTVRTIVFAKVQESKKEESKQETKTSTSYKKTSYRDEEATDKRTASMNAKDIIVALITNGRVEVESKEKIEKAISALTKKFYEVIKNL